MASKLKRNYLTPKKNVEVKKMVEKNRENIRRMLENQLAKILKIKKCILHIQV